MRNHTANQLKMLAASGLLAMAAGMPPLGQQTRITERPGSGVVRERDKPHGFWGNKRKHKPRVLTPEARAKHEAKMRRRYERWAAGVANNGCLSLEQRVAILNRSRGLS